MLGFIKLISLNNLHKLSIQEIKKLFRFYIYLFKPNIWLIYKFIYKKIKYTI